MFEEVKVHSVIQEGYYYMGDIYTACSTKKWWRVVTLFAVMITMLAAVLFVKPLLIAFLTKWICATWGVSLFVGKSIATCVGGLVTAQVRKLLKFVAKSIDC
ncbi:MULTISPECIES: hypothetical protein [unclassified Serratia (in: enterobacteria)]|uniref:hypothetical protein n=1 Tax=unclassified Serratia (in: enterobacteria) TaxID=2647522 RepID=UPI0030767581